MRVNGVNHLRPDSHVNGVPATNDVPVSWLATHPISVQAALKKAAFAVSFSGLPIAENLWAFLIVLIPYNPRPFAITHKGRPKQGVPCLPDL